MKKLFGLRCHAVSNFQSSRFSSFCLTALTNRAAIAPSISRWSDDSVIFMIERTTTLSSRTTGFLQRAGHGEDGALAGIDDRGEVLHVEHAHVGDGEGAAGHLVGRELAGAGLVGEFLGARVQLGQRQFVRVADRPARPGPAPATPRRRDARGCSSGCVLPSVELFTSGNSFSVSTTACEMKSVTV